MLIEGVDQKLKMPSSKISGNKQNILFNVSWISSDSFRSLFYFPVGSFHVQCFFLKSQAGGPFYPVFTGRRDSNQSYFQEAMDGIPKPDDNITQTLHLFTLRGFNEKDTVSLLGKACNSLLYFKFDQL